MQRVRVSYRKPNATYYETAAAFSFPGNSPSGEHYRMSPILHIFLVNYTILRPNSKHYFFPKEK
jgi:hypothetical protein